MRTLRADESGLAEAVSLLRAGDLVAIPTETVYGLAGDGRSADAVARIFAAKQRPTFDPLILHLPASWKTDFESRSVVDLQGLHPTDANLARALAAKFWPGPLTLVLPRHPSVPDLVTSGLDSVAVRVPAHPTAQELLERFGGPLAAPSANRFGRISPTHAAHVIQELSGRAAAVIDGGPCAIGLESTVIRPTGRAGEWQLLRPGALPREAIEALLGAPLIEPPPSGRSSPGLAQPSPGLIETHYAPSKPLELLVGAGAHDWACALADHEGAALLFFSDASRDRALAGAEITRPCRVLSPTGSDVEAARNLFSALRELDASPAPSLLAELPLGTQGLIPAIRDRLERAGCRYPTSTGGTP
ncbi:MAG: threonylcarbamoyl-AMP synthase [Bdellovibrionales bacterium]|nr:threonylcarbamoyl-AMP synthase [Bdellovibrionales bacterium]